MMREPLTWSLRLGRWFGIPTRLSLWFLFFAVVELYRFSHDGQMERGLWVMGILGLSVLFHEYGHSITALQLSGTFEEIILWPLGGLASVELDNRPDTHACVAMAGPAVNLMLCLLSWTFLSLGPGTIPWNPFVPPSELYQTNFAVGLVGYVFWINEILLLANLIPAFPMDGSRLIRSGLWKRMGFERATLLTVQISKITAIIMALCAFLGSVNQQLALDSWVLLVLALSLIIYVLSERERQLLETGLLLEDTLFGYDFSQGYMSLENNTEHHLSSPPGLIQQLKNRRLQQKQDRQQAREREEEQRMDAILSFINENGMDSVSSEDRRFLNRASARYRQKRERRLR